MAGVRFGLRPLKPKEILWARGKTTSRGIMDKQREKSEAASSKVTAFVKVQSKLHKCQHLLFTATKGRMLSSLEIAYLVKHCNVIKKKKFKFLSTTASLKSRKYPGAGKMKTSFINTVS